MSSPNDANGSRVFSFSFGYISVVWYARVRVFDALEKACLTAGHVHSGKLHDIPVRRLRSCILPTLSSAAVILPSLGATQRSQ